jgi:uncharacterized membrane protein
MRFGRLVIIINIMSFLLNIVVAIKNKNEESAVIAFQSLILALLVLIQLKMSDNYEEIIQEKDKHFYLIVEIANNSLDREIELLNRIAELENSGKDTNKED